MKTFLRLLSRMDILDRIIVFVSMCLFVALPSMVLYFTDDDNYTFYAVMPSLLFIGSVLGNGVLTLYRPLKTAWFYFLIHFIFLPWIFLNYDFSVLPWSINSFAVLLISMIYCGIGFLINLLYFFTILRRKGNPLDEKTNNDSIYDFLGGQKKNVAISDRLDHIMDEQNIPSDRLKHIKLSRTTRLLSFAILFAIIIVYMISTLIKFGFRKNEFFIILLLLLISSSVSLVYSMIYPVDFKYIYYFNL